ncbi:SEC-C metal-binding domain-containing protein [Agathobaculum desmolans]|uniref:SEC-C metal-binding domain-containing protein n=1 Tax=Agathobaculum desmolans TaxID=39484 RepID=UPI000BFFD3AA
MLYFIPEVYTRRKLKALYREIPLKDTASRTRPFALLKEIAEVEAAVTHTHRKIGRNEPCPCGSGKKYKHCCGR